MEVPKDGRRLSHIDDDGKAQMVDVGNKADTRRLAIARGRVMMRRDTLTLIEARAIEKGDVWTVARVAGIQAAKRTHELIPLCHPLLLTHIEVTLHPWSSEDPDGSQGRAWVDVEASVQTTGKTGVEMEALTAVSVAALTIYDMVKAIDRSLQITDLRLVHKSGGRSGSWNREEE